MKLGDRVKDRISGVTGILVGYHYWLYGCERVSIQPEEIKDGKPAEPICIDAAQTELLQGGVIQGYNPPAGVIDSRDVMKRPAGPRPDATRRSDPVR
jgi:hypothetical protein